MIRVFARRADTPEEWYELVISVKSEQDQWGSVLGDGSCCLDDIIRSGEGFVRVASQAGVQVEHAGLYIEGGRDE